MALMVGEGIGLGRRISMMLTEELTWCENDSRNWECALPMPLLGQAEVEDTFLAHLKCSEKTSHRFVKKTTDEKRRSMRFPLRKGEVR